MGFSTGWGANVFTQGWVDKLSKTPERFMPATVQFLDPVTRTVILTSKARVQPVRTAVPHDNDATDTMTQVVLVSIPIGVGKTLDLRPMHRAAITSSPLMPVLTNFLYVVSEVLDSANAIERTFYFTVDLEVKVT